MMMHPFRDEMCVFKFNVRSDLTSLSAVTGDQNHQEEAEQPVHRLQQEPKRRHHQPVLHQR